MHKKLIMSCMAIAAFAAFVVAPAASASPVLTYEGKAVASGTLVIATNSVQAVFTGTGGIEAKCTHVKLTGKVTKNSGTVIEGELATADFNGTSSNTECTSNLFNVPVAVTVPKLCMKVSGVPADIMVFTGCGANATFTLNFTNVATCKYSRAEVQATLSTVVPWLNMNSAEESNLSEGGAFCPGGVFLTMNFEFSTDLGGVEFGPLFFS